MKTNTEIKQRVFDPCAMAFPVANEGQTGYCGVSWECHRTFSNGRKFIIAIYGCYCVYGLYGSEKNGIVILDDTNQRVLLDEHVMEGSGYFGPSQAQVTEFTRLMDLGWEEFQKFINAHARSRTTV
jgi:hypothetical protein